MYYTDYAGVSAAAVGVIMLISRVFDGVSDLIMGNIVDRTRSRYGKVLSVFRNLLATAGSLFINTDTLRFVECFGDNAAAWSKTFGVFGLVAVVLFLVNFAGCKERVKPAVRETPAYDDFDEAELGNWYYAPRIMPQSFTNVKARPGYVRIRGQESRTSLNKVSILARKLTSIHARITTKMEFQPEVHQHSAGLILYCDNMNYINLRKYYSETLGQSALSVISLENGEKTEFLNTRTPVEDGVIYLRLYIQGRESWFEWSYNGVDYQKIGRVHWNHGRAYPRRKNIFSTKKESGDNVPVPFLL